MAPKRIKVYCYREVGRSTYRLQWVDRRGKRHRESTGTNVERTANRIAGRREKELNAAAEIDTTSWSDFRKRFEVEVAERQAHHTERKLVAILDEMESVLSPTTITEIDTSAVDKLTTGFYRRELAPATIAGYLRYVRWILGWASERSMLTEIPKIKYPENSGDAGGRPITTEEFERIIEACNQNRGETASSWAFLLRGLWWSGLRRSEAMALTWGENGTLTMDLESRRPMFAIRRELSKNRKTERFPMSPEFFELIDSIPSIDRSGFVFNPERKGRAGTGSGRLTSQQVGETIGKLGRAAGVKVKTNAKGNPVFASAHDLRRSFGFRWAKRVMPPILQSMMRHADIKTTMKYYVTQVEEQAADAVWEAMPMRDFPPILPPLGQNDAVSPAKDKKPRACGMLTASLGKVEVCQ